MFIIVLVSSLAQKALPFRYLRKQPGPPEQYSYVCICDSRSADSLRFTGACALEF